MNGEATGKELVLTNPTGEAIARRSKPHLMQVGNRYLSSDSRWHPSLAVEYVLANARGRWLPVGELARTFFGASIPTTKKKIRRRLPSLFSRLSRSQLSLSRGSRSENEPRVSCESVRLCVSGRNSLLRNSRRPSRGLKRIVRGCGQSWSDDAYGAR